MVRKLTNLVSRPGRGGPYPHGSGTLSVNQEVREELVRLGVELSLSVVQSMFLLCDDLHTMLSFCLKLWNPASPAVTERLVRVIHHAYSRYIKPKNSAVYQAGGNSFQFELVRSNWGDFSTALMLFHRLVMLLKSNGSFSYDDRLLLSAVADCKQALDRLDGHLSCGNAVSVANGFVRETIESDISAMWKSLFGGADEEEAGREEETIRIFDYMFLPLVGKPYADLTAEERALPVCGHQGIQELPMRPTYILSNLFAKQALKEDLVKLGVRFSLLMAQSMFLLSDDIHGMLLFCHKMQDKTSRSVNPGFPIHLRLLRGMHHVYTEFIKPKHAVYDPSGSRSGHLLLAIRAWKNVDAVAQDLDLLLWILRGEGTFVHGRDLVSGLEKALKRIEVKLRSVKEVLEANGYARDEIEPKIYGLWKSIFVPEVAEVSKLMRIGICADLFRSLPKKN